MVSNEFSITREELSYQMNGVLSKGGIISILTCVSTWTQVPYDTIKKMYEMCVSLDIVILTIHDYLREKGIPLDEYHESIFKHTKEDCDGIVELLRTKLSVVEQAINRMYGDIEGQVLKEMDGIEV